MTQVNNVAVNKVEVSGQKEADETVNYDQIVENLVAGGLPVAFNPNTYLNKIASNYDITLQDARVCLKLAIKELENKNENKSKTQELKEDTKEFYAQSGYYYPSSSKEVQKTEKDGMDNLNSFGTYNRLMFNIR